MNFLTSAGRVCVGVVCVAIAIACGLATIVTLMPIFMGLLGAIIMGACTSAAIFGAFCMFAGGANG